MEVRAKEDSWASDPNAFVADEDDEMVSYNVRAAAIDFVAVRSFLLVERVEELIKSRL